MNRINNIYKVCAGQCTWTRDNSGIWTVEGGCTSPCSCFDPDELKNNPAPHPGEPGTRTPLNDAMILGKIALYNQAAGDAQALRRTLGSSAAPDRHYAIFNSASGTSTASAPQTGDTFVTDCYEA